MWKKENENQKLTHKKALKSVLKSENNTTKAKLKHVRVDTNSSKAAKKKPDAWVNEVDLRKKKANEEERKRKQVEKIRANKSYMLFPNFVCLFHFVDDI